MLQVQKALNDVFFASRGLSTDKRPCLTRWHVAQRSMVGVLRQSETSCRLKACSPRLARRFKGSVLCEKDHGCRLALGRLSQCFDKKSATWLLEVPSVPKKAWIRGPSQSSLALLQAPNSCSSFAYVADMASRFRQSCSREDLLDMFDWLEADESDSKVSFQALQHFFSAWPVQADGGFNEI